jgi:hypothetical protein
MPSLLDLFRVSRVSRYVSVRVHGTSAQIQLDEPPSGGEFIRIERLPTGTQISSNTPAHLSVHFSIPTPLLVEHTEPLFVLRNQPSAPVFKDSSISVVRIELYLNVRPSRVGFRRLRAMDGDHTIAQDDTTELAVDPNVDEYSEEMPNILPMYVLQLNKRVYTALGVSFEMFFTSAANDFEHGQILLVAAKAIFLC